MASFAAVAKSAVAARRGLKVSIDTSPPHRSSGAPSPGSQRSKAVQLGGALGQSSLAGSASMPALRTLRGRDERWQRWG